MPSANENTNNRHHKLSARYWRILNVSTKHDITQWTHGLHNSTFRALWSHHAMYASVSAVIKEAVAERCSVKKGVLKNFTKFTGKHLH